MSPSSSLWKNKQGKKLAQRSTDFILVYCLAYYYTLNMEAKFYFEISVDFQRHYIPEDINIHNHRCESPKSYFLKESYRNTERLENTDYLLRVQPTAAH